MDDNHKTKGFQHEAGDRTHVCLSQFSDHISGHPFIQMSPNLMSMAEEIEQKMGEFYQAIWNEPIDD